MSLWTRWHRYRDTFIVPAIRTHQRQLLPKVQGARSDPGPAEQDPHPSLSKVGRTGQRAVARFN